MESLPIKHSQRNIIFLVIVASMGYFVDIYDIVIFSIVRIPSFHDIGIQADVMRTGGEYVLNMQMAGLLVGGLVWGIIGDKFGRVRVLFGSIILYSIANIANAFVHDLNTYAIIRFIAGFGLAGELGAGITLVSETMHRTKRGYGTMWIATVGVLGAIAAFYVAEHFAWRNAYIVGGVLGLILLLLRVGTFESGIYINTTQQKVALGSLKMLFGNKGRLKRYIYSLLIGLPIWFVVGIFVTQAPEFGKALGAPEMLSAGKGILYSYIGISIGDLLAGLLAQITKSRKLAVFSFQILILISSIWFLYSQGISQSRFHTIAFVMGLGVGYWATFVTIASEQFGTNLRATVTTTAPNFVRGALIPCTFFFEAIVKHSNIITGGLIMIVLLVAIAFFALIKLPETFDKDLDYLEE